MRFELVRYHDTSVEVYGKRGMGWYRSVSIQRREGDDRSSGGDTVPIIGKGLPMPAFDHVSVNDSMQDCWILASLLHALLSLLRLQLPALRNVSIITDNEINFVNDAIPVLSPLISASHGLRLKGFIHQETTRGNSLVETHLSVAIRRIQRFVRETEADVTTPMDIWRALHYDGGIRNSTSDLIHVCGSGPIQQSWRDTLRTTARNLARMGPIAEVLYDDAASTTYYARVLTYSGGEYTNYVFGNGFSQMSRKGGAHSAPVDTGAQSGISAEECAGIGVQGYIGDEISGPSKSGTSVVATSVGMESDFRGAAIDVIVFGRRSMRYSERCPHIRGSTFLKYVYAEIEADGTVAPTPMPLRRDIWRANYPYREFLSFTRCGRAYRRVYSFQTHEKLCKGKPPNKQVLNLAMHMSLDMVQKSESGFYSSSDAHPMLDGMDNSNTVYGKRRWVTGWSRLPTRGEELGRNTVPGYM